MTASRANYNIIDIIGGDLAPSLEGQEKISQTKIYVLLGKKFHFDAKNFL